MASAFWPARRICEPRTLIDSSVLRSRKLASVGLIVNHNVVGQLALQELHDVQRQGELAAVAHVAQFDHLSGQLLVNSLMCCQAA